MAGFRLDKLEGEPIVMLVAEPEWDWVGEFKMLTDEFARKFDSLDAPAYFLDDFRGVKFNFQDMLVGIKNVTQGANALLHHPNLKEMLIVTDERATELIFKGLQSDIFGNVRVKVFRTVEDALEYVHSH